jgi:hypothetical protein
MHLNIEYPISTHPDDVWARFLKGSHKIPRRVHCPSRDSKTLSDLNQISAVRGTKKLLKDFRFKMAGLRQKRKDSTAIVVHHHNSQIWSAPFTFTLLKANQSVQVMQKRKISQ